MRTRTMAWLAGLAAAVIGGSALADEASKHPLRLLGEAPSAKDPAPNRFVIDAIVTPGDDFQSSVEGWFAQVGGDDLLTGSIDGSCVEKRCTISIDVDGGKFALIGDFDAAGPTTSRFAVKDSEGKTTQQGAVTLSPIRGPVAGVGELAGAAAVDGAELDELLMWNGQTLGFGTHDKGEPPSTFQRGTLAEWQGAQQRPANGLILVSDLAQLRAGAASARKAAGWTAVGDAAHGWAAGYPAAVLPKLSRSGAEQRYASADGKATLVIAIDPPMSDEDFGRFVDDVSGSHEGRDHTNYTRVNSDMQISYHEQGKVVTAAYFNREGGFARLVFTYPESQDETYAKYADIVQRSLTVTDDLKR